MINRDGIFSKSTYYSRYSLVWDKSQVEMDFRIRIYHSANRLIVANQILSIYQQDNGTSIFS
jgi:hypothetical protein